MRVGVVDIGTNSTRLLVAEVDGGTLNELDRRTTVTRLGEGLEASGRLSDAAMARVSEALADYREALSIPAETARSIYYDKASKHLLHLQGIGLIFWDL